MKKIEKIIIDCDEDPTISEVAEVVNKLVEAHNETIKEEEWIDNAVTYFFIDDEGRIGETAFREGDGYVGISTENRKNFLGIYPSKELAEQAKAKILSAIKEIK